MEWSRAGEKRVERKGNETLEEEEEEGVEDTKEGEEEGLDLVDFRTGKELIRNEEKRKACRTRS